MGIANARINASVWLTRMSGDFQDASGLLAGSKNGGFTQRRKGAMGFKVRIANWDERGIL